MTSHHYFTAQPSAAHRPGQVRVVLPDLYLELATDSGVFSPGRLDPGTRLLLEEAPPPPASGDILDLGCGYGPIACSLAARAPGATVWAVDVNERALGLCAANALAMGVQSMAVRAIRGAGLSSTFFTGALTDALRDLARPGQHRWTGAATGVVVLVAGAAAQGAVVDYGRQFAPLLPLALICCVAALSTRGFSREG